MWSWKVKREKKEAPDLTFSIKSTAQLKMQLSSGKQFYQCNYWHYRITHVQSFIANQIIASSGFRVTFALFLSPAFTCAGTSAQVGLKNSQHPKAMPHDLREDMSLAALCPVYTKIAQIFEIPIQHKTSLFLTYAPLPVGSNNSDVINAIFWLSNLTSFQFQQPYQLQCQVLSEK